MSDEPIIGVDARPLCHPGSGLFRYTHELLRRMTSLGGQWRLYSPAAYDESLICGPNIQHRTAPWARVLGGNQSSQFLFPTWLRQDRASAFWGTRHDLPIFMSRGIHAVLSVHDLTWMTHPETMPLTRRVAQQVLFPRSLERAHEIISVSQFTADELRERFPHTPGKTSVVYNASSMIASGTEAKVAQDESGYFLFVGTMEPRKNLPRLLQAYKRYRTQCQNPRKLRIVGGHGWGGIDPVQLVTDNDLHDSVQVLGKLDDAALANEYAHAYALLMPSLYEGFGLPVVEALSFGVPSLVSENSAMSEVAAASGEAVDPLSIDSMASALTRLTENPGLQAKLGSAALLRAKDFDWDQAASAIYQKLIQ
jgi:glycosyltransferase involved in cell wall biosynthesis